MRSFVDDSYAGADRHDVEPARELPEVILAQLAEEVDAVRSIIARGNCGWVRGRSRGVTASSPPRYETATPGARRGRAADR